MNASEQVNRGFQVTVGMDFEQRLGLALEKWSAVLQPEQIVVAREALEIYELATFPTHFRIAAILKPRSSKEVSAAVKIANALDLSVYPISQGKNWGYGSTSPTSDKAVIFDLSEMNKIVEFSEKFGTIRVEPGVTISQVFEFLTAKNADWILPPGGMTPSASLVGNILERGFAQGATGNRIESVSDFEVVLADGNLLATGLRRFKNAKARGLYRWGVGPSLDGMFTQSNFGIVTEVTVWLARKPSKHFQSVLISSNSDGQFSSLIDALRESFQQKLITEPFAAWNSLKILAIKSQYPWAAMLNRTPISNEEIAKQISKSYDLPISDWNIHVGLYSSSFLEAIGKRYAFKKKVKGLYYRLALIGRYSAMLAKVFARPYKLLFGIDPNQAADVAYRKSSYLGHLSVKGTGPIYWRKKFKPTEDSNPNVDKCGLIWITSVIPFDSESVAETIRISREVLGKHKFDPMFTFIFLSERHICNLVAIKYDREVKQEEDSALACRLELRSKMTDAGYPPYRLGLLDESLLDIDSNYLKVISRLREAFDPKKTIAPGRYGIQ